jgi:hypothetical protein
MAQRKKAMILKGPGNKIYTGYCFYDSEDRLQGWVLGDEADALVVAEWLSEKVAESDAMAAAYAEKMKEDEAKAVTLVVENTMPKRKRKPKPVEGADLPLPEEPEEPK